jgi:hypothetical protein
MDQYVGLDVTLKTTDPATGFGAGQRIGQPRIVGALRQHAAEVSLAVFKTGPRTRFFASSPPMACPPRRENQNVSRQAVWFD